MLRPFRSLITYIQKNANSAAIFGVSSSMNEERLNDEKMTMAAEDIQSADPQKDQTPLEQEAVTNSPIKESVEAHDQNENLVASNDVCEVEAETVTEAVVEAITEADAEAVAEVVAETVAVAVTETVTEIITEAVTSVNERDEIENVENEVIEPVEEEANVTVVSDESVVIVPPENAEVTLEVSDTSEIEEYCSIINSDPEVSIVNEIVNLDDEQPTDVSDPIEDDPSQDPLAIEDYQADIIGSPIHSSPIHIAPSALKTSVEGDVVVIIDVDSIKSNPPDCESKDENLNETVIINSDNDSYQATAHSKCDEMGEEQEVRSDGSDSGLGAETIGKPPNVNPIDGCLDIEPIVYKPPPARGNLKRRSDETLQQDGSKRAKKSITFDGGVTVYYFPRMQGFACVPSQGGCTLGMGSRHISQKKFTLAEHAAEQRRVHKQQMQEVNPRGSSSDETDSDEEISEASGSDLEADGSGFLQPVSTRQRRAILKAAGIRRIESSEKDECRVIRVSREYCGCICNSFCDPDTCSCSQAGIKCQVDRPNFPCGCTRDGCANVVGRVEFNPSRVRTHYIHTIMRLGLENKQKRSNDMVDNSATSLALLSYTNTRGSTNSNSPVTATMTTCVSSNNDNVNSLSNVCNYNSHLRSQQYGHSLLQHLLNSPHSNHDYGNGVSHPNMYANNLNNGMLTHLMTENCGPSASHLHRQNQSPLLASTNTYVNNSQANHDISNSNINCNNSIIARNNINNVNHNHQNDMHYSFREGGVVDCQHETPSPCDTDNTNIGMYFPNTDNQLYHETYNGNNFINPSYNTTPQNVTNTFSSYQQSYINYASSTCNNQIGEEIYDLNSTDEDGSEYINLHPPVANSERLDAINDLLQTNRNTTPATSSIENDESMKEQNSLEDNKNETPKNVPTDAAPKAVLNFEQKFQDFIDVVSSQALDCEGSSNQSQIEESDQPSKKDDSDVNISNRGEDTIILSSASSLSSLAAEEVAILTDYYAKPVEAGDKPTPPVESVQIPVDQAADPPADTDENLSEIIKKSIVETVSA